MREQVEAAYHVALAEGSEVLVERYIPGIEHRMLVVGGKLVAAARGKPPVSSATAARTSFSSSTARSIPIRAAVRDESFPLEPLQLDKAPEVVLTLQRQGFTPESIPPAGKKVLIALTGKLADDVTDEVHPRWRRSPPWLPASSVWISQESTSWPRIFRVRLNHSAEPSSR
ncbi:MAG: hypothetical protein M5R42_18315 [Rhodocyclaceae bacterium]|nr:hypothetical protein [Rhodocyclaceae bacterium]